MKKRPLITSIILVVLTLFLVVGRIGLFISHYPNNGDIGVRKTLDREPAEKQCEVPEPMKNIYTQNKNAILPVCFEIVHPGGEIFASFEGTTISIGQMDKNGGICLNEAKAVDLKKFGIQGVLLNPCKERERLLLVYNRTVVPAFRLVKEEGRMEN